MDKKVQRVSLLAFLTAAIVAQGSNLGPELELDCPCTFSTDSVTSAFIDAGITNIGASATGQLDIKVWAHTTTSVNDAGASLRLISQMPVISSLPAHTAIARTTLKTGLKTPGDGTYYLTFELVNNGAIADIWRLEDPVTFTDAGGGSEGEFLFDSTPTISIDGSTLTLNVPAIINNSLTTSRLVDVRLFATDNPSYFESDGFTLADHGLSPAIGPNQKNPALTLASSYTAPPGGFDYFHMAVVDSSTNETLVFQTVQVPAGETLPARSFSVSYLDYLVDSDGDGVGDVNEKLAGTDPSSNASTPGASILDILALYGPGVTALYNGDPSARIDHLISYSNQVLSDSQVDIQLRLVGSSEINMDSNQSISQWLDDAGSRTGIYSDLDMRRDEVGADLIVLFQKKTNNEDVCGLANLGGFANRGDFSALSNIQLGHAAVYIDFDLCQDNTTLHELGHLMGLGHSFRQDTTGTFDWSRGHGVDDSFATLMAYGGVFNAPELPLLSNPAVSLCEAAPCGIDINLPQSANAAKSLNIVRFQIADFRPSVQTDSDGDGVFDSADAFPNDPTESVDTDSDGVGNNADTDDDNDGLPDSFEIGGLDPLDATDRDVDTDGDGATNLEEFETGTDPNDALSVDACFSNTAVAIDASASSLALETRLYFANPGSNTYQQTFLRFVNPNDVATNIEVYGIDDGGNLSAKAPISFTLAAQAAKQINAQDVENGNTAKGLSSNLCNGQGKWQFRVRSDNPVKVMGLIRTPDGFLTSLDDVVPKSGDDNFIYFANPAANSIQQTFLRIVNTSSSGGTVTITGIDDDGITSPHAVSFSLNAYESKQITSQDLENGNSNKGLTDFLDDGAGKWRLTVTSQLPLEVMSLIRTPDGFLTNLSGVVDKNASGDHLIYFANAASELIKTTFLRIINTSNFAGSVTISGIDDVGNIAPSGDVTFELAANAAKQMIVRDIEDGNLDKGLIGMLGDGSGRWRLTVASSLSLQVMSLVRTPDGFVTNLSRTAPVSNNINNIYIFNPGSNTSQRSSLRVVNDSNQQGSVTISAFDDNGTVAPGGAVTFNIAAGTAMLITAQDLENGNTDLGLVGSLGDGAGKWRLEITSDVTLVVQGLLDTPTGFLTNLSQTVE